MKILIKCKLEWYQIRYSSRRNMGRIESHFIITNSLINQEDNTILDFMQ